MARTPQPSLGSKRETVSHVISRFRQLSERAAREVLTEVDWRVRQRTPVRTGRLKGNWRLGLGAPDTTADPKFFDPTGRRASIRNRAVLQRYRLGDKVWLTNFISYFHVVEYGTEKMLGSFMLSRTRSELHAIVAAARRGLFDGMRRASRGARRAGRP